MNPHTPRHSRSALIFLVTAIVAALLALPLLRAVGMAQWPVFALAWLINLGAAWHLGQWARQQGRPAWAFGGPALLGTVALIVVYVPLAALPSLAGSPRWWCTGCLSYPWPKHGMSPQD